MRSILRLGTRGSTLALIQTDLVGHMLSALSPGLAVENKIISVKGDRDKQTPLPTETIGKAWFTAEIEDALIAEDIDLAVHSLKDVPPEIAPGSIVMPVLVRADPRDALISKGALALADLKPGAIIGTDSSRRKAQLLAMRPDLVVRSLRGNVEGRLRKLAEEGYDAIVLAVAGLERLGKLDAISEYLDPQTFVPAPGQGALAAQARIDDVELIELLTKIQDPGVVICTAAERAFIDAVGGGCKSPIGAYAAIEGDTVTLRAMIGDDAGTNVLHESVSGAAADSPTAASELASRMLERFNALA